MDFDELNRILEIVRQHELSEFELEREGFKIKIRKGPPSHVPQPAGTPQAAPVQHVPASAPAPGAEPAPSKAEIDLAVVKSPIVGTFFRSSEPGAPPFVEVGDVVKTGQV